MDKILRKVKESLPQFNNNLLISYRQKQVNETFDFISDMFSEATKILSNTDIEYLGYRLFTPEERVIYETNENIIKNSVNIRHNELVLVGFDFKHDDEFHTIQLYLPYLFENFIILNNIKYSLNFSFTEKLFSKIKDGISIKVIRSPLKFTNEILFPFTSIDGTEYIENIISAVIHQKNTKPKKKDIHQTIMHYLLCKFGFQETIKIFNLTNEDICFTPKIYGDGELYEYFCLKKHSKNADGVYIKAKRSILNNNINLRIIANTIYILHSFRKYSYQELTNENNNKIFMVLLGKLIYGRNLHHAIVYNHMVKHFYSLNTYLDTIIKKRFELSGIYFNTIYDLLVYIFINIDKILVEYSNNNLYERRIDIFQTILVKTIVEKVHKVFYKFENQNKSKQKKYIKNLFNISPKLIYSLYDMSNVKFSSNIYNDNWLISIGSKAIKQFNSLKPIKSNKKKASAKNELSSNYNKFHPSFAVIESLIGFSSNNPSNSCVINPFAEINEDGGFIKPKYAYKLDKINKYLSQ